MDKMTDKNENQSKRIHNLETDLSYYVKRCRSLEQKLKGAISSEYGAFLRLGGDVLYGLDRNMPKEWFYKKTIEALREYLGTDRKKGKLADEINWQFFGIIDSMEKDYPDFGPYEINLFCCMVIEVKNSVLTHVFDLGTEIKTAGEKTKLIKRIWGLRNRARVKYMTLLERE